MPTLNERLRRTQKRLGKLSPARLHRRVRTLYWRRKWRNARDPKRRAYYLRKARESAALGEQIEHTSHVVRKRARFLKRKIDKARPPAGGVVVFDGKPCAAWIAEWLKKSREAGWNGVLVSGWRDPVYSEQLCLNMCGAPSCPGRCAGRVSNHSGSVYPAGAVDVSDYTNFGQIQRRIGSPLINALGAQDPVHFSVSGK